MLLLSVFLLITSLLEAVESNVMHEVASAAKFAKTVKVALATCPGVIDKKLFHRYAEDVFDQWDARHRSTELIDETRLACIAEMFCRSKLKSERDIGKVHHQASMACSNSENVGKLDSSLFDNDGEVLPETSDMPSVPNENFNEGLDSREVWFSITKGNVVSFLFGLLFGYLINHLFKGVLNSTAHSKVIRRPEL